MARTFGIVFGALALSLSFAACTGSETIDEKPAAEVKEPLPPEPVKPPEVTGTPVNVDAMSSKISWLGAKVTKTHSGGFKSFEGAVLVNGDNAVGADFTIDLTSVFSDTDKLTEHIKSADFFDVGTFGKATFTTRDIKPKADGANTHEVTGELDLHGQKKTVTFPAAIAVAADKITVKADFKINRQDWGIAYPGKPDDLIKDEVGVTLDLSFPRAAAATPVGGPEGAPVPATGSASPEPKAAGVGKAPGAPAEGTPINTAGPGAGVGKAPGQAPAGDAGAAKKGGERK